jgi:outer membrane protein, heavy metal efflux system
MVRYVFLVLLFFFLYQSGKAQRLITQDEAVNLAINNQRNLRAANLSVQQQEQLLTGVAGLSNPQVFGEITPYEPLLLGVQQTFSLPVVYRRNKALQVQTLQLARLQLQGTQYNLKRDLRLSYLGLQYLAERRRLLLYQDSIYQAIKVSSKRFFDAGQINKLEELQSTTQADAVRNELNRIQSDVAGALQLFSFLTGITDSFNVSPLATYVGAAMADTGVTNIQQQILQQQIAINEAQLDVTRASLLPQVQAGVSFPTTSEFERPLGAQVGITIPIWRKQNRSQIAAARTDIEVAKAQQELSQQRLNADYRQAIAAYRRELQSLTYFNQTALPQARAIIETSQRLFQGGELNYIESLRNLQTAFDIFFNHLETHRAYNEAVIQLNYLNGTL